MSPEPLGSREDPCEWTAAHDRVAGRQGINWRHRPVRTLILSMYDNEQYLSKRSRRRHPATRWDPLPTANCSRRAGRPWGASAFCMPVVTALIRNYPAKRFPAGTRAVSNCQRPSTNVQVRGVICARRRIRIAIDLDDLTR
jgi:hypothetical protein